MKYLYRVISVVLTVLFIIPLFPIAGGDGMPVYRYVPDGGDAAQLYGTTFETRQLASIELLNSTHQRINLFLSIFTLNPGVNLTVLVPFRERPLEVTLEESTDSEFLKSWKYEEIVQAHRKQHWETSGKRMVRKTEMAISTTATSVTFSPLGLGTIHYMKEFRPRSSGHGGQGVREDSAGKGEYEYDREVKEIAHYNFEGVSVSVYSVTANATLEDFLSVVDLGSLPNVTREVVEEYREQYVAVIESEPSPPIDPQEYSWLLENVPDTTALLIDKVRSMARADMNVVEYMASDYAWQMFREMVDSGKNVSEWFDPDASDRELEYIERQISDYYNNKYEWKRYYSYYHDDNQWHSSPYNLTENLRDMLHAIYGFSDFKGNILSVTTELNDGDMYYPLGTSKGWDNPIQDTKVIYVTDEDIKLTVKPSPKYHAFHEGKNYYIMEYASSNPGSDTTGIIEESTFLDRFLASFWTFVYDGSFWISLIIAIMVQCLLWFFILFATRSFHRKVLKRSGPAERILTGKHTLMMLMNILISAPLTFILIGWKHERPDVPLLKNYYLHSCILLTVMNLIIFFAGVS